MNTQAIATYLDIAEAAVIEIQEWASVFWVKFVGGCRFVSKKKQRGNCTMDFSALSNDQLLELIQASITEASSRGLQQLAQSIYLSAQEKARLEAEAIEAAKAKARVEEEKRIKAEAEAKINDLKAKELADRNSNVWSKKAAICKALASHSAFEDDKDFQINIWQRSEGGEKRIYIQGGEKDRRGNYQWEIIYYATGSKWNAPGSLEGVSDELRNAISAYCELLDKEWRAGLKVCLGGVRGIVADEQYLAKYQSALGVKEVSHV